MNIAVPHTEFALTGGVDYYKARVLQYNGVNYPAEHIEDSKELDADAYIDLFEIVLAANLGRLFLKQNHDAVWQGNTYEGTGIKLEGVGTYADDEVARPTLSLFNPDGVFSYLVDQGGLENAKIIRYRVLKTHVETDTPVYRRQQWFVKRIASLRRGLIALELRDMLDGQAFMVPGRMFIPPEFPIVSLQ